MQLHNLSQKKNKKEKARVGRGGKRGKTSGRGHKGQKARAGGAGRPELRDIIKKLPKRRGYGKNRSRTVDSTKLGFETVNLSDLNSAFGNGERVTPKALLAKGMVARQKGRTPRIKILGKGVLEKKLSILGCDLSQSAREHIEKVGGTIEVKRGKE